MREVVMSNLVEVVFVFDTTGSMQPCISAVRKNVEMSLTRLFKEVPNLRIGIGVHGDYCDKRSTYVTKWQTLTRDIHGLCHFVRTVEGTNGGDAKECYELVLHEARALNWSPSATKILVMIGDELPHSAHDPQNVQFNHGSLDWHEEAQILADRGIMVHTIQCLNKVHAAPFYREVARQTGGYHFTLDQFSDVTDLIMAICYKQARPTVLEQLLEEILAAGRMTRSVERNMAILSGRRSTKRFSEPSLDRVPDGRFQIMYVDGNTSIKNFVLDNGLIFKKGRGFYEFTKTETIQGYKEVVLRDKITGDMYTGDKARKIIGAKPGVSVRIGPADLKRYDVFVQSTSVNRKLIAGTRFLYEVDMDR